MINRYSIFNGAKYFSLNGLQNDLVFQLFISHFSTKNVKFYLWEPKWMSKWKYYTPIYNRQKFYPELIGSNGYEFN